jgi:hypothetical protein
MRSDRYRRSLQGDHYDKEKENGDDGDDLGVRIGGYVAQFLILVNVSLHAA